MGLGLSDQVRTVAKVKYVQPALQSGKKQFSIRVRDLMNDLRTEGFPAHHTPQICTALQTSKFLLENGLEIEGIDGPPSKMSPTVVFRYRVADAGMKPGTHGMELKDKQVEFSEETPEQWAHRLTGKLSAY